MNPFHKRFSALMLGVAAMAGAMAGCQSPRPIPSEYRPHQSEAMIPRSDDLFPDGDSLSVVTPAGEQAHNRNRRRDQKRRAERRDAGRNKKQSIGARKKQRKQRSGGRTHGR